MTPSFPCWIKRFVNNCRKPQAERNFTPVLSPAERNAALRSLVRVVQAEHFEEEVGPGPQCIGYVEVPLTSEEKIKLVIRLNQRRAAVARGRLRGFPTAGNMMKLMWIEELAREAQLWADQCEPPSTPEKNDACRDLYSVGIGQCVASVIGEAPGLRPESMVDIWYMQNMFYRGNVTAYDPPVNQRYNYYGDFAQLVHSKTYMVGCGRSRFMALLSGRLRSVERLVCNFAPRGPNAGRPLWTVASPGSACPPRSLPDDNVPALCTVTDTVRRLQEELDRMEQALSVDTSATTNSETRQTTSERADKVRRSLKDGIGTMTNDSKGGGASEGEAPRASKRANDDFKIEIGFGVPLGAMSAHPAFHSAWDIG
ncbi:cysteine-rich secretory protein family domain-containing protein [Phthorimaea operculella]|nr:cysteine-rich secretory protein family domain-containing protein [Phthorimaea operculella]